MELEITMGLEQDQVQIIKLHNYLPHYTNN